VRAGLDLRQGVRHCERFIPPIEAYAPHLLEEMRGIAGRLEPLTCAKSWPSTAAQNLMAWRAVWRMYLHWRHARGFHNRWTSPPGTKLGLEGVAFRALVLWVIRRDDGPDIDADQPEW
jgi:hypothetical protein